MVSRRWNDPARLSSAAVGALLAIGACIGDPVGPDGRIELRAVTLPADSTFVETPGDTVATPVVIQATDRAGRPVGGARVTWSTVGAGAAVLVPVTTTDATGSASAVWKLGTKASEIQQLQATVQSLDAKSYVTFSAHLRPSVVSEITAVSDTLVLQLGASGSVAVRATDPYGNVFTPSVVHFSAIDTTVVGIDSTGRAAPRRRGFSKVVASSGTAADTSVVHVIQIVQEIRPSVQAVAFHSLGETKSFVATLIDAHGLVVADSVPTVSVSQPIVTASQVGDTVLLQSVSNGPSTATLSAGGVTQAVSIAVDQVVSRVLPSDSAVLFDALGDTARVTALALDSLSKPVQGVGFHFGVSDTGVANVDANGVVLSKANGSTAVTVATATGITASVPVSVTQRVTRLKVARDTLTFTALQAVQPLGVTPLDRLGNPVGIAPVVTSGFDSTVVSVSSIGIRAVNNGVTMVSVAAGAESSSVVVRVAQKPIRVLVPSDTVRFVALGETQTLGGVAVDSLGSRVAGPSTPISIDDTSVIKAVDSATVRSRGNGAAHVSFSVAGLAASVSVVVAQVPESVSVTAPSGPGIAMAPAFGAVGVTCQVFDRNGFVMPGTPSVSSRRGTLAGNTCGGLTASHSGWDTLDIGLGSARASLPLVVAVTPTVSAQVGELAEIDSFPSAGGAPWAPSLIRAPDGSLQLYFTVYSTSPDSTGFTRGNSYRYESQDGVNFSYDGMAVQHDSAICSPQGQGIEHVAILPRSDAPGWRMLYAAGSDKCYGWEVFSAVSADGRNWVKESGIRLSNGNTGPKGAPPYPPYPVGEGIYPYQTPDGVWHLIVGTQAHVTPSVNKWQIAEWHSSDQLAWTYGGTVFTTDQMPSGMQGSVYSPTIRQVAPGLWRMLFTADNRGSGALASSVWSAVSTDLKAWQLEGQVFGAPGSTLYYVAMVDDHVVFLRRDSGGPLVVSTANINMP